jgi:hypothetical protein
MIQGYPNAFEMFDENPDMRRDCHRHCACYDETGECCDCGDQKGGEPVAISQPDGFAGEELLEARRITPALSGDAFFGS